tara:strand:- start:411 stop:815 length:405 start_codon:yes stop_codon:yes gene_type:complete
MSTLLLNTLTGKTSAGSIVVTGEGGSTTTNLQQGLLKQWVHFEGDSADLDAGEYDSFNTTSLTDNGTGDYDVTIANDMSNEFYVIMAAGSTNRGITVDTDTILVGSYNLECFRYADSSSQDPAHVMSGVAGDLA